MTWQEQLEEWATRLDQGLQHDSALIALAARISAQMHA